ncbi:MAG: hypothetical protein ACXVJW_04180 [Acidimicrobiia bacterium]
MQGTIDDTEFDRRLDHMARFEQELHDDGALILKFWIHLPRRAFKKRAKRSVHKAGGDLGVVDRLMFDRVARPGISWRRVTPAIATSR